MNQDVNNLGGIVDFNFHVKNMAIIIGFFGVNKYIVLILFNFYFFIAFFTQPVIDIVKDKLSDFICPNHDIYLPY